MPHPAAALPTDLVAFRNSSTGLLGPTVASNVDEPSVSNNGRVVFYTGNWYAAVSVDSGASFTFLNPLTNFPSVNGGFCCDQVTVYDPSRDLTIWELMYGPDASGNSTLRIAVANGQAGVAVNAWHYWDLTAQQLGFASGNWYDYPQLALSSNFLYLSTNVFSGPPVTALFGGSVIYRITLDSLTQLGTLAGATLTYPCQALNCPDTFTPVSGATSTMYWAAHNGTAVATSTTSLLVASWPETAAGPSFASVTHSGFIEESRNGSCAGPDGRNMCGHDDSRVKAGWATGGVIGFLWDAGEGTGSFGTFPYPYVQGVRLNESTLTLIDEPAIWNTANAYLYPSVAVNSHGGLGLSIAYGGGSYYPSSAVGVADTGTPPWQIVTTAAGTSGPPDNVWGDYLTARPASGNGATWLATGYTLQGAGGTFVEPRLLWFGRRSDDPFAPSSVVASAPNATAGQAFPAATLATFTGPSALAADYSAQVDWGDGTASEVGSVAAMSGDTFKVTGSHAYAASGSFTLRVAVADSAGSTSAASATVNVAPVPSGYWLVASDGGIFTFGTAPFKGSTGNLILNKPIVGMTPTPSGQGYWLVASDGGIFTFGDATFLGSEGGGPLTKPIVAMATTPTGKGYWLAAADGGLFTHGDAAFFGSMGGHGLTSPIVGMATTPSGKGYWLVAADGGIFTFGDASFFGSEGGGPLTKPIVAMAATPTGKGYWLVASDGGLFTHGDATFFGSMGGHRLTRPVNGMAATRSGKGYWLVASDGGIFTFGDAPFLGSTGSIALNKPVAGMAAN
jgi:hypothetical protein